MQTSEWPPCPPGHGAPHRRMCGPQGQRVHMLGLPSSAQGSTRGNSGRGAVHIHGCVAHRPSSGGPGVAAQCTGLHLVQLRTWCTPVRRMAPRSNPRSCSSVHRVTPGVAWAHCGPHATPEPCHVSSRSCWPLLCVTPDGLWTSSLLSTPPSSQPMGTCGRLCPTCRRLQPRYGHQSPRYGRQSPRYGRLWVGRAAKSQPTVNLSSLIT